MLGEQLTRRRRGTATPGATLRERGAVALEAALVLPLMITLVFGIIEFSLLLKDQQGVASASRAGARLASTATSATNPNFAAATAASVGVALTNVSRIGGQTKLWIYRADAAGYPAVAYGSAYTGADVTSDPPPAASESFTTCPAGACASFTWNSTSGSFVSDSGNPQADWPEANIVTCQGAPTDCHEDHVGVYISSPHHAVTGLFGLTFTMTEHTVLAFEPVRSS